MIVIKGLSVLSDYSNHSSRRKSQRSLHTFATGQDGRLHPQNPLSGNVQPDKLAIVDVNPLASCFSFLQLYTVFQNGIFRETYKKTQFVY